MSFLIQGYASIDDNEAQQSPLTQYIIIERQLAKLWRKGSHITVPVEGIGQLYALTTGVVDLKAAPLSVEITIRSILGFYENSQQRSLKLQIGDFILDAHRKLQHKAKLDSLPKLGASMVMAWCLKNTCYWANVGNNRLYLLRDGELQQISIDHDHDEFAKRYDIDKPQHGSLLAQAFLQGQTYPSPSDSLRIDLGVDVMNFKLKDKDILFLSSPTLHQHLDHQTIRNALLDNPNTANVKLMAMVKPKVTNNLGAIIVQVNL